MRHCLVMADKVAKLPSLVNNLITNQGVTLFPISLKKMSISLVFYIIPACVRSSKPLHAFRNIGLIGFEEQMVVVIHENIGVNLNLKPFRHFSKISRNEIRSSLSVKMF